MIRRRKVSGSAANAPDSEATPDPGSERWAGNPEEPAAAAVADPVAQKDDRHPFPWGLVISDVFNLEVHKLFKQLELELTLGDGATEYGTLLHAVDKSARNLYDAARLCRKAKLVDEQFAEELDKRLEVLRSSAVAELEEEKLKGMRSKAPTIKDIDDRMLKNWPDEYGAIKSRKAEMHGAFRALEALEGAWRDRCQSLRSMAQGHRTAGV
jgi:hypothetical protein